MSPHLSSLTQYTAPFVASSHEHTGADLRARRIDSIRDTVAVACASIAIRSGTRLVGTTTLPVVAMILRKAGIPLTVRQLVDLAGAELPTRSKTPSNVVARDLAMDIKKKGESSAFVRTSPGRYTLRELTGQNTDTRVHLQDPASSERHT